MGFVLSMSKNAKNSRNITPKGVHNYTADAYDQAIILQRLHNLAGLKTEPKKEEKVEEERRESGRKSLRKKKKLKKWLRTKI